ncbi:MAG: electron transport complex subunit RsxG [Spongiibacteraceae bacterium]
MSDEQISGEQMTSTTLPFRSRMPYHGLLLGIICLGMTLALMIGYRYTRNGIEAAALQDRLANLAQVLPASLYNNNPVQDVQIIDDTQLSDQPIEVYLAKRDGKISGVAFQVKRSGYGGPITLLMALDAQGNILGVRVLAHKETPGLADRIDIGKDNWITRFDHRSLSNTSEKAWHVKKDGGDFDQFTGATITPRAVVGAVYQGLLFHERHFLKNEARESSAEKTQ